GLWMLAALLTVLVAPRGVGVPFLPGIVIYVAGKALTALGNRGTPDHEGGAGTEPASIEPERAPPPAKERPVARRNEYLGDRVAPTRAEAPDQEFEVPDLEEAILKPPPPMSSEEMIAEARRRFGPRPFEEEG
ncbi:MAG: hypothetical protein KY394_02620, partial [Actinobacteria bacterium]|nr:hypothetical protein [Actinomycetota bacterium]